MNTISNWLCTNSTKTLFVKIVHPGGHVELHDRPVLAAELLRRNPKCCVAHPTVFHQPYAAVVSPETTLVLGHKYYVVPLGTIRKLRLKYKNHNNKNSSVMRENDHHHQPNYNNTEKKNEDDDDDSSDCKWLFSCGKNNSSSNNNSGAKEKNKKNNERRVISDDLKKGRRRKRVYKDTSGGPHPSSSSPPGRLSLASMDNWHPGLDSIHED